MGVMQEVGIVMSTVDEEEGEKDEGEEKVRGEESGEEERSAVRQRGGCGHDVRR